MPGRPAGPGRSERSPPPGALSQAGLPHADDPRVPSPAAPLLRRASRASLVLVLLSAVSPARGAAPGRFTLWEDRPPPRTSAPAASEPDPDLRPWDGDGAAAPHAEEGTTLGEADEAASPAPWAAIAPQAEPTWPPLVEADVPDTWPAPLPPPPVVVPESDRPGARRAFIGGDLVRVGSTRLVTTANRVGVDLGYAYLDGTHYGVVVPEVDLHLGALRLGLGVPLRLELLGPRGFADAGRVRAADWDEPTDYAKVIRYLAWGHPDEGPFFLQVSRLDAQTLGRGALVRRYYPNGDVDDTRVGVEAQAEGRLVGLEAMLGDVTAALALAGASKEDRPNLGAVAAARVFARPLALTGLTLPLRSLAVGASWAGDVNAPRSLAPALAGRLRIDPAGRPVYDGDLVSLYGVDLETSLLRTETVHLEPYADLSALKGAGWGATLGLLAHFDLRAEGAPRTGGPALRAVAEVRAHTADYDPGYFDGFYEVDKYAYAPAEGGGWLTKWEAVSGRDPAQRVWDGYLEVQWAWVDRLALGAGLELSTLPGESELYLHLELPAWRFVQLFVTWHKRGIDSPGGLFDLSADAGDLFAEVRLHVLPLVYLNLRGWHALQFDASPTRRQFRRDTGLQLAFELAYQF